VPGQWVNFFGSLFTYGLNYVVAQNSIGIGLEKLPPHQA
jgi:hypothetical protein